MAIDKVTSASIADGAVSADTLTSTAITGQTAETTIADDDLILISDTSASAALKKMTKANFVSGVGGGKILQVVEAATTTAATTTSTTYVTTGLEVSITPSATSSKILVFASFITGFVASDRDARFQLYRDSTSVGGGAANDRFVGIGGGQQNADNWFTYGLQQFNIQKLDSPSTTSATTYKLMFNINTASGTAVFGRNKNGDNVGNNVICAMEVGA